MPIRRGPAFGSIRSRLVADRDQEPLLGEVEAFVTGSLPTGSSDRVLATVLLTDILSSNEKAAELGDARWKELLVRTMSAPGAEIDRHRGRYVDSTGDGHFATFDGPAKAVRCAPAIGASVRDLGIQIRAGVHTGELELEGNAARGIAVHLGARVAALAVPPRCSFPRRSRISSPGAGSRSRTGASMS